MNKNINHGLFDSPPSVKGQGIDIYKLISKIPISTIGRQHELHLFTGQ